MEEGFYMEHYLWQAGNYNVHGRLKYNTISMKNVQFHHPHPFYTPHPFNHLHLRPFRCHYPCLFHRLHCCFPDDTMELKHEQE